VFLGTLAGSTSPVGTFTALLGAQIDISPRLTVEFAINERFEHGVLLDVGALKVGRTPLAAGELAYQGAGKSTLALRNTADAPARALLLGGEPFGENLLMWWNFVGRTHDEIAEYREQWQNGSARFGAVHGYQGTTQRLPAPPLPTVRLKPRRSPSRRESP